MIPADTVTHPPIIPRGLDPAHVMTRADVESMIDSRLQAYNDQRRVSEAEQRVANVRQRVMTYGVSGLVGLAAGVGLTYLVQRARRGRGPGAMKA